LGLCDWFYHVLPAQPMEEEEEEKGGIFRIKSCCATCVI
jgi:hypothetical protein